MGRAVLGRMRVGSIVYRSTSDGRDLQGTGAQAELGHSALQPRQSFAAVLLSSLYRPPKKASAGVAPDT
jgi:hypothetical protein